MKKMLILVPILLTLLASFASAAINLTDGLVGCYNLSSDMTDYIGTHDGANNGLTFGDYTCPVGNCAKDSGSNEYATIGDSETLLGNANPDTWTYLGWVKNNGGAGTSQYFMGDYGTPASVMLQFDTANNIVAQVRNGGTYNYGGVAGYRDGNWHHFVFTVDKTNTNGSLWMDNTMIKNKSLAGIGDAVDTQDIAIFQLGSGGNYFTGWMDEIAVYNRIVSSEEIDAIYTNNLSCKQMQDNDYGGGGTPTPFSTTLSYPTNGTTYTTDYTGDINITLSNVNGSATCTLNNSDWSLISNNNVTVHFQNAQINYSGNYSIEYYCNDTGGTWSNSSFWFYLEPFKINATDFYNSSSISTFNTTINGRGNYTTTDGTLETDIPYTIAQLFNITISAADYFDRIYSNVNVSSDLATKLWQYQLNITAVDAVSGAVINTFNISMTYLNLSTSSGITVLNLTAETHLINVTASGYEDYSLNITGSGQASEAQQISMNPYLTFSLYREKDNSAFDINSTTETKMTIYCPTDTQEVIFNTTTTVNYAVSCPWTFMKMDVTYNASSYFRTLIPEHTETSINWYLLDLNHDLAVQVILNLNDLTGDFLDGKAILKKYIGGATRHIIDQEWDVEHSVVLYLLKDALYTLSIEDETGTTERNLGYLTADAADEKTITIPEIDYVPESYLGDLVNWTWDHNGSWIKLYYDDISTSGTTNITFSIYNASDPDSLLYSTSSNNVSSASFTYTTAENQSYIGCILAYHPSQTDPLADECKSFIAWIDVGQFDGWSADAADKIKTWFSVIIVLLVILLFGPWTIGGGLGFATFLIFVFQKINWMDFGSPYTNYTILSLIGFAAVVTLWLEARYK